MAGSSPLPSGESSLGNDLVTQTEEYLKDPRTSRRKFRTLIADPDVLKERARKIADRTTRPLAAIRARCIGLHDSTKCGSIDHRLWWRHPRHQSAPRGRNSTGQSDPASRHDCERTSMPRRHPSEPSRHGYPNYGYPIGVWLIWLKNLIKALFRATTITRDNSAVIQRMLKLTSTFLTFTQCEYVCTCYGFVQMYRETSNEPQSQS